MMRKSDASPGKSQKDDDTPAPDPIEIQPESGDMDTQEDKSVPSTSQTSAAECSTLEPYNSPDFETIFNEADWDQQIRSVPESVLTLEDWFEPSSSQTSPAAQGATAAVEEDRSSPPEITELFDDTSWDTLQIVPDPFKPVLPAIKPTEDTGEIKKPSMMRILLEMPPLNYQDPAPGSLRRQSLEVPKNTAEGHVRRHSIDCSQESVSESSTKPLLSKLLSTPPLNFSQAVYFKKPCTDRPQDSELGPTERSSLVRPQNPAAAGSSRQALNYPQCDLAGGAWRTALNRTQDPVAAGSRTSSNIPQDPVAGSSGILYKRLSIQPKVRRQGPVGEGSKNPHPRRTTAPRKKVITVEQHRKIIQDHLAYTKYISEHMKKQSAGSPQDTDITCVGLYKKPPSNPPQISAAEGRPSSDLPQIDVVGSSQSSLSRPLDPVTAALSAESSDNPQDHVTTVSGIMSDPPLEPMLGSSGILYKRLSLTSSLQDPDEVGSMNPQSDLPQDYLSTSSRQLSLDYPQDSVAEHSSIQSSNYPQYISVHLKRKPNSPQDTEFGHSKHIRLSSDQPQYDLVSSLQRPSLNRPLDPMPAASSTASPECFQTPMTDVLRTLSNSPPDPLLGISGILLYKRQAMPLVHHQYPVGGGSMTSDHSQSGSSRRPSLEHPQSTAVEYSERMSSDCPQSISKRPISDHHQDTELRHYKRPCSDYSQISAEAGSSRTFSDYPQYGAVSGSQAQSSNRPLDPLSSALNIIGMTSSECPEVGGLQRPPLDHPQDPVGGFRGLTLNHPHNPMAGSSRTQPLDFPQGHVAGSPKKTSPYLPLNPLAGCSRIQSDSSDTSDSL